MLINTR